MNLSTVKIIIYIWPGLALCQTSTNFLKVGLLAHCQQFHQWWKNNIKREGGGVGFLHRLTCRSLEEEQFAAKIVCKKRCCCLGQKAKGRQEVGGGHKMGVFSRTLARSYLIELSWINRSFFIVFSKCVDKISISNFNFSHLLLFYFSE